MTEIYPSQWYDQFHTMGMVYITILLQIQCKKHVKTVSANSPAH